jgi:hypothetical protein
MNDTCKTVKHIVMMKRGFNVYSNKSCVNIQEVLGHIRTVEFCLCVSA